MGDREREAARALLFWYAQAGLWDISGDAPVSYYGRDTQPPRSSPSPSPASPIAAQGLLSEAQTLAAGAKDLDSLKAALASYDGCALKDTARNLVFSDGVAGSRLMLVGEAPGADEDEQGIPFVGRSGRLLDVMLSRIGLSRKENVYIANVIPWRPPGNRNPSEEEKALCRPFLERHIVLSGAELIVALGAVAARELLGLRDGITKIHGTWHRRAFGGKAFDVMATLHPAYLLRQPKQKALAWQDLRGLRARLDEEAH